MIGKFCIFRSRDQGVVTGYLRCMAGRNAEVEQARQVHYWTGANTLFEMSLSGCGSARISEPVAEILILDVCGVIPCTPEAEKNLTQSRWNEDYNSSASSRPLKTADT